MIKINNNKFINGEEVYINGGRLKNVRGFLIEHNEEKETVVVKVGTISNVIESKYVEKIHREPKLFLAFEMNGHNMIYKGLTVAVDEDGARKRFPDFSTEFLEVDEVDNYDVVVQKMANIN